MEINCQKSSHALNCNSTLVFPDQFKLRRRICWGNNLVHPCQWYSKSQDWLGKLSHCLQWSFLCPVRPDTVDTDCPRFFCSCILRYSRCLPLFKFFIVNDSNHSTVCRSFPWVCLCFPCEIKVPILFALFLYISLPLRHDYDVKMPIFTFYRESTQATTKFPLSFWTWIWFLGI